MQRRKVRLLGAVRHGRLSTATATVARSRATPVSPAVLTDRSPPRADQAHEEDERPDPDRDKEAHTLLLERAEVRIDHLVCDRRRRDGRLGIGERGGQVVGAVWGQEQDRGRDCRQRQVRVVMDPRQGGRESIDF